jgi:hypothetical protein
VLRISTEQRRARLATRHHLAASARTDSPVTATRDLVVLHATDPATVYLSLWARLMDANVEGIEQAMYDHRTLVRMLAMRRTMFVAPAELVPVLHAGCTQAIALRERRRLVTMLADSGVGDDVDAWLDEVGEVAMAALTKRGEALASELSGDDPRLARRILLAAGKSYAAEQSVVTRVLFLLAAEGRVVRGRPRGSWVSRQNRWVPTQQWLPGVSLTGWSTVDAQVELVRRWLAAFGPGTEGDLKWWTGWTLTEVRRALAALETVEVELDDGGRGLVLADDTEPVPVPDPWVTLLPALDPTVMGYTARDWFLGEHRRALFDTNGNAGPTIWCDGRVVGGWAQRKDGQVVYRILEDVGRAAAASVAAEAARLTGWLASVRVTPSFRTPLERELAA